MGRHTYPNEVVTTIPAGTPDELRRAVLRELLAWCGKRCNGGYQVTTTQRRGRTRLAMHFENKDDVARFEAAFSRQAGR